MIGPVSGTGRAMMASLQQAIQKGMPPDQAIQYVKSMATQGVAPLADLYAMMNQFQRLKQQQVKPPQTPPTIRDQLNMAEQQQAQQQAMMQQGVASLPAPVMDNAQFAGGGIVAFANRGLVEDGVEQGVDLSNVSPEQLESLAAGENLAIAKAATKEILRRTGYKPLGQMWKEGFEQGMAKYAPELPLIRYDPRPLPSYMYDENGEVRKTEMPTAGIAGVTDRRVSPTSIRLGKEATGSAVLFPDSSESSAEQKAPPAPPSAPAAPSRRPAGAALSAQPVEKEPTMDELRAAEMKSRQAYMQSKGIGEASKQLSQFLSEENNRLTEQFGRDKMLAFAEAGFKMAAAASRPGATFLGALSEGAISGTQALRGLQKEMDANRRGLQESMLRLREAEELKDMGEYDKATTLATQARNDFFERKKHADAMRMDERRIAAILRGQDLDYGARLTTADAAASRAAGIGDTARLRLQIEGLDLDYKDQQEIANDITRSDAERQQARTNMGAIRKKRDELVSGATLSGASSGASNPYSGFTAEEEGE